MTGLFIRRCGIQVCELALQPMNLSEQYSPQASTDADCNNPASLPHPLTTKKEYRHEANPTDCRTRGFWSSVGGTRV